MTNKEPMKHFKCPKCKRVTATDGFIPKCKCTGKNEQLKTVMEEIK